MFNKTNQLTVRASDQKSTTAGSTGSPKHFPPTTLLLAALAAMGSLDGLAQPVANVFKLQTANFYIQAGLVVNPSAGSHLFPNPPAGPGLWCTPAELILNGAESVTARDYPLCPDPGGLLQRTRHDSAPHANDLVPSAPWQFDITCPVPNPGPGARETRISGSVVHPGANHSDLYSAVVGAMAGTSGGFVIIHGSIGKHTSSSPHSGSSPMIGGCTLQPPSGQAVPNQSYPAGELLTIVDPTSGEVLLLLVLEGVPQANLGSVYVRNGQYGANLMNLRPLMQTYAFDSNSLALTITNRVVPLSVAQVMASGNAYISAMTTAHPDGQLIGALTTTSSNSSYQVQIQPGWNVIANQLSRGSNTLAEVLPSVPPGSLFCHWDLNAQTYTVSTFDPYLGGWDDPTISLAPGEGGFIKNPSFSNFTVTFVGETIVPQLPLPTPPPGQLALVARQNPAPATYEQITGLPPADGVKLYRYDSVLQSDPFNLTNWTAYTFSQGQWTPATPSVGVGEPVFIQVPSPTAPVILDQPQSQAVAAGTDVAFTAQAAGQAPLVWQWFVNGMPIQDATGSALSLTNVQSAQAGIYSVTVANSSGSVTSNPAQLLVNNAPVIAAAPILLHQGEFVDQIITASDPDGNHLTYSLSAGGLPGMSLNPATGDLTWDSSTTPAPTTTSITVDVADDGTPPLHTQQIIPVIVAAPLRIQAITRDDGGLQITWNSIPSREYVVRAASELPRPVSGWEYRAAMVAETETTTWHGFLNTDIPCGFYTVTTTCGNGCNCLKVTKLGLEPNQGQGAKGTFDGVVPPTLATVEVPFIVKARIACTEGDRKKSCVATLRITGSATCEIIDKDGNHKAGPATADPFNVEGNDPNTKDWKTLVGTCSEEHGWSAEVKCSAKFKLGELTTNDRKALVANPPTTWIRATFTFNVWVNCNGQDLGPSVITMVVDFRDSGPGRWGHFDRDASDLDGDKKFGKDEKDNTPGKTETEKYLKDLDPNPDPLVPK